MGLERAAQPDAQEWGWDWDLAQDPGLACCRSPFLLLPRQVVSWKSVLPCLASSWGQGSSVGMLPRATQPGGLRGPGICPHKRVWSHAAFISPFRLRLTEPSSTCLGAGVSLAGKMQQGPSQNPMRQLRGARYSPC